MTQPAEPCSTKKLAAVADGDAAAEVVRAHVRTGPGAKSAWRPSTPDAR